MSRLYAVLFLAFSFISMPAAAEPWVATGQTPLTGSIDNPDPNVIGALGEVDTLPYIVPVGCVLTVEAYGIESYPSDRAIIFLWTGWQPNATPQYRVGASTASVLAYNGSNEFTGVRYQFPEDSVINVRLIGGSGLRRGSVYGWYVSGDLTCN